MKMKKGKVQEAMEPLWAPGSSWSYSFKTRVWLRSFLFYYFIIHYQHVVAFHGLMCSFDLSMEPKYGSQHGTQYFWRNTCSSQGTFLKPSGSMSVLSINQTSVGPEANRPDIVKVVFLWEVSQFSIHRHHLSVNLSHLTTRWSWVPPITNTKVNREFVV